MRPIGFVICCTDSLGHFCTKGKIYPYYKISSITSDCSDYVSFSDDFGNLICEKRMFLGLKKSNNHHFDFYHYPEFPEDIGQWTEDDWFQYDLKYGG